MIMRILITIVLIIVAIPTAGTVIGLGIGKKGENIVIPTILVFWVIIIYFIWFR